MLLQPWPTFVEMMYFRRRKWMKTKNKKNIFAKNVVFFPQNQVKTKKKGLHRNLRPFSAGNLWDVLVLAGYFLSDHPALNSWWEDAFFDLKFMLFGWSNINLFFVAEAGIVLDVFLNFGQNWVSCSYKLVLIKKYSGIRFGFKIQ